MRKNIALITSTIAPAANAYLLQRRDPQDRLNDYKVAFDFYTRCLQSGAFDQIVYVDNSGYPLDQIAAIAEAHRVTDRVEYVSYVSDIEPVFSRYYLEINLIKQAMQRSKYLSVQRDDSIWKLTGRYLLRNVAKLVRDQPTDFDLYVNVRNYPERALDFYLAGFRGRSFDAVLGADLLDYRTQRHGELILRDKIEAGRFADHKIVSRFTHTPRIVGVRGFDGARYHGTKYMAKYLFRVALNRVAPSVWV